MCMSGWTGPTCNDEILGSLEGLSIVPLSYKMLSISYLGSKHIYNYLTAVQYTIGKDSLNGRETHIICQNMFLFGEVYYFTK